MSNNYKSNAIAQMKKLGISDEAVGLFEKNELISQSLPPDGKCSPLSKEQLEFVKQLERDHGILVYFAVHSCTSIGEIDTYLYVDSNEKQQKTERDKSAAYIHVRRIPKYSGFGIAGFEATPTAGLRYIGRADILDI